MGSEKLPPTLLVKLLAQARMTRADDGADFFRILAEHAPRLMPGVGGPDEPPRARFDWDRMRREWGVSYFWRSREPPVADGSVLNDPIEPESHLSIVSITVAAEALRDAGDRLDVPALLHALALRFEAWFGYAHVLTAADRWTFGGSDPYSEAWIRPGIEIHERRLRQSLPPLPWATVLGGDLLERVGGGERVRGAPAAVAQLLDGRIGYLQLTEAPLDTIDRFEDVAAARQATQDHLGGNRFSREIPPERKPSPATRTERNAPDDAAELLQQCFAVARDLLAERALPSSFGAVLRENETWAMVSAPEDVPDADRRDWLLDALIIEAAKRDVVCVAFVTTDGPTVRVALEHRDRERLLVERTLNEGGEWSEPIAGDIDLRFYGRWHERFGNTWEQDAATPRRS